MVRHLQLSFQTLFTKSVSYCLIAFFTGFSHTGTLHNPITFASNLPDKVPIVLVFGAQATKGIDPANHPYVSPTNRTPYLFTGCGCFLFSAAY